MSRIGTGLQGFVAAASVAGALAMAAPASALTLISATMDTANTAYITGPAFSVNAYIGPVTFTVNDGGPNFSLTAYCVDIYHDMFLGALNGGAGYAYHPEDVDTDSRTSTPASQSGAALSALQEKQISSLLNYSDFLIDTAAGDLSHKLAGIQGAIWEIENPLYAVNGGAAVNGYISTYKAAAAVTLPVGTMHSIFADDYGHQAFAYGGGVPEPGVWTMLILGFGGVGAVLRQRRQAAALV